jgi:hypothetical protein
LWVFVYFTKFGAPIRPSIIGYGKICVKGCVGKERKNDVSARIRGGEVRFCEGIGFLHGDDGILCAGGDGLGAQDVGV